MMKILFLLLLAVCAGGDRMHPATGPLPLAPASGAGLTLEQPEPDPPVELGYVRWGRDLEAGLTAARKSGKPVLILFQEMPGCSNCTRYGTRILRHPLVVEAIETLFEPVCIYNNRSGKDAAALQRFGEPAWNNPVVRIVGADGKDWAIRIADFGSMWQLVAGMREALGRADRPVPLYLHLLEEESRARESSTSTATFSMYCFWSGEGSLGELAGVIETTPGFQNGQEVVRVVFDPVLLTQAQLSTFAKDHNMAAAAQQGGFRADKDLKYYLAQTHWRAVPMTALQACRANSLAGKGESPQKVLSPRQAALGQRMKELPPGKWKNQIGRSDLAQAWQEMTQ